MKVTPTFLPEVLVLEPSVHEDDRGFFLESWNAKAFGAATGLDLEFVQDNHSWSKKGVLRGIHYQVVKPQGKLVRVVRGEVLDVAVDLRRSSDQFGKWVSVVLSQENKKQLWIPPGFGHGFVVMSDSADFLYKTTEYWIPSLDRCIRWNDEQLAIDWRLGAGRPLLGAKDAAAPGLKDAEVFP